MISPTLSAKNINALLPWAVDLFEKQLRMYFRAAMQDGSLPLSEKPKNELEEMDLLAQEWPYIQQVLAQPPDPSIEAERMQAQQKAQRLMELRMKYAAHG